MSNLKECAERFDIDLESVYPVGQDAAENDYAHLEYLRLSLKEQGVVDESGCLDLLQLHLIEQYPDLVDAMNKRAQEAEGLNEKLTAEIKNRGEYF